MHAHEVAVIVQHLTQLVADDAGRVEHRAGGEEILSVRSRAQALAQQGDGGLGGAQIAGRQHHDHPVPGIFKDRHLPHLGDLVDAGIGTGIRGHDEALIQEQSQAVGHLISPKNKTARFGGMPNCEMNSIRRKCVVQAISHVGGGKAYSWLRGRQT